MINTQRLIQIFLASRPSFLTITAIACLLGFSITKSEHHILISTFGMLLALMGHAGANLINDFYDSRNGSDSINTNRIPPFTGGSRVIQNGLFSESEIKTISLSIFIATAIGGIILCYFTSWTLIIIGLCALLIGWAYSSPPAKLMSRGVIGELAIVTSWSLITVGAAILESYKLPSQEIIIKSLFLGVSYGLMTSNILFVNQIPDIEADSCAGKITWAVSTPKHLIKWYYLLVSILAYLVIMLGYLFNSLEWYYLYSLATAPLFVIASNFISKSTSRQSSLKTAIKLTILGVHIFGIFLIISNIC